MKADNGLSRDSSVLPTLLPCEEYRLAFDDVHSWCVRLDIAPETMPRLYATLAADEQRRSGRYRFERDRYRFIVARGILRQILGHYLRVDPCHVRFAYHASGKPVLSPEHGSALKFNISHTAQLALIAVATDADVGVDLEYLRDYSDQAEIARRYFSTEEVDHLNRLPSYLRAQGFFSCWTLKEAYVKARGEDLAMPLTDFNVPWATGGDGAPVEFTVGSGDIVPPAPWSLYTLRPASGYVGALAIEGSGWHLSQRNWDPKIICL